MSIEGIANSESVSFELDREGKLPKVDFTISSKARPKICTAFESVRKLDEATTVIVLSDGSRWELPDKGGRALQSIAKQWKVGDDVRINRFKNNLFVLKNVQKPNTRCLAALSK